MAAKFPPKSDSPSFHLEKRIILEIPVYRYLQNKLGYRTSSRNEIANSPPY